MRLRLSLALFATLTLAGCRVGPNYHTPPVPTPPAFQEPTAATDGNQGNQAAAPPLGGADWWTVFQDPILNDLEHQAFTANYDLRIAVARIDQADAYRRSIRSQEFPQITAQPAVSRTREAQQRPNNGNTSGRAATFNDVQLPIVLNYEVDLWGRIRRQVTAAAEAQQASVAQLHFLQLTTTSTLAASYFVLREADAETAILESTLVDLRRGYDITNNQFHRGIVSELPPAQAKTLVDQTTARLAALAIQRSQSEHAIAVLAGRTVEGFRIAPLSKSAANPGIAPPPVIPAGIPADVLRRRPDVFSAERYAASASEQIGVAKAAYFPQIALTGFTGFESSNPGAIFAWQNTIANLATSAIQPIFTGGRLRANVDQARASYQQYLFQYQKTVLIAYQETEDQLAALHDLSNEFQSANAAVQDATVAAKIAGNRYNAGLVSYLDVVYAQQTLLLNQQTATQVQGQRLTSTVSLIRALGGAW